VRIDRGLGVSGGDPGPGETVRKAFSGESSWGRGAEKPNKTAFGFGAGEVRHGAGVDPRGVFEIRGTGSEFSREFSSAMGFFQFHPAKRCPSGFDLACWEKQGLGVWFFGGSRREVIA